MQIVSAEKCSPLDKKLRSSFKRIPSTGPSITQEEIDLVTEAVTEGWYENMNRHIRQFTEEFSAFVGMKYCLPVSHGTAAIHLALLALDIGPGDEVIVPDITWVASACPVSYVGAKPVFVDIDPRDLCLDPSAFEKAITKRTKAVMVVDLLGNMPQMDAILEIADRRGIPVIEDAAEGIGATYKGRPAGTFGKISAFSFNATKLVIGGQGGMFVTQSKKLFERAKRLSHHGMIKNVNSKLYWSAELGFNYNWTNIQAALALAQLRRLPELLEMKRRIFSWYRAGLEGVDGVTLNQSAPEVEPTYWLVNAFLEPGRGRKKRQIQEMFKEFEIDARPFFYPVSSMPPYAPYCVGENMKKKNPVSYRLSPYGISLPSGFSLTESDVGYVCESFREILKRV